MSRNGWILSSKHPRRIGGRQRVARLFVPASRGCAPIFLGPDARRRAVARRRLARLIEARRQPS
jgi:hypothetical protein